MDRSEHHRGPHGRNRRSQAYEDNKEAPTDIQGAGLCFLREYNVTSFGLSVQHVQDCQTLQSKSG
eukprot:548331-Prorocentrum_lima.AAC.1